MEITRNNYEQYIIDYIDGNLNAIEYKAMGLFLANNADIAEELDDIKNFRLDKTPAYKVNKAKLYKKPSDIAEISDKNFEEFCIAYYEGDMDLNSTQKLRNFITGNLHREAIFKLYSSLRFVPDKKIVFNNKRKLKKYAVTAYKKRAFYYSASIAAIILLAIIIRNFSGQKNYEEVTVITKSLAKTNDNEIRVKEPNQNILTEKSIDNKIKYSNIFAAVDTHNIKKANSARLSAVEPKRALINNIQTNNSKLMLNNNNSDVILSKNLISLEPEEKKLRPVKEGLLIKALKFGIQSIGNLTENNLELVAQSDKDGNIVELGISTGQFGIFTKKNNTTQQRN